MRGFYQVSKDSIDRSENPKDGSENPNDQCENPNDLYEETPEVADALPLPKIRKKRQERSRGLCDTPLIAKCMDCSQWDRKTLSIFSGTALLIFIFGVLCPVLINQYLDDYRIDLGTCNFQQSMIKFECLSGASFSVTEDKCLDAGCCWNNNTVPQCFHEAPSRYNYRVQDAAVSPSSITINLEPIWDNMNTYGLPLFPIKAIIQLVNPHHLIIQLLKQDQPHQFRLLVPIEETTFDQSDFKVDVAQASKQSFGIRIHRKSTDEILFDTTYGPMTLTDQYVEMTTTVSSSHVYGFASDHRPSMQRSFNFEKIKLFSRKGGDGFHPFYMGLEPLAGHMHGVFWDNTYPLEVQFSPTSAISFRSMGGSGVIHLLSGPTPAAVSKQLAEEIIGRVQLPPFWSLGYHLCRESDSPNTVNEILTEMTEQGIGFDSDCIDLRLSGPGSGNIDHKKFPKAEEQRQFLEDKGKKFILAQPPHVLYDSHIEYEQDQWILKIDPSDPSKKDLFIGERMGQKVLYPSFFDVNSTDTSAVTINMTELLCPDGIHFIDNWPLNEDVKNHCNAQQPFIPIKDLVDGTVCVDAIHPSLGEAVHLAVHNHYGTQHALDFIRQQESSSSDRLLYLNQASSLGNSGKAGSSGDDLSADWISMKIALVQVLETGLTGIPLAGSPICGSLNNIVGAAEDVLLDKEELCIRWYQMGLLLPLARTFSRLDQTLRTPVDFPSVTTRRLLARYIQERYRLLPYFYTLLYQASVEGTPLVRPMFYQFPQDNQTYEITEQFMIGDAIMVCPVTTQSDGSNSVAVTIYFPQGTWYDYYTGQLLVRSPPNGTSIVFMTPISHLNIFVKEAAVFVTQEPGASADETRRSSYTVTTTYIRDNSTEGYLYVDDGTFRDPSAYDLIHFQFNESKFVMNVTYNEWAKGHKPDASISTVVDRILIYGIELSVAPKDKSNATVVYDADTRVLEVSKLNFDWSNKKYFEYNFGS